MYHSNNDITLLKNSLPGWMGHNKSKLCVCVCVSLKPSSQKVEQVHELGERDTWWNLPVLPITWLTDEAEGSLMEAETRATRLVATGDLQKVTPGYGEDVFGLPAENGRSSFPGLPLINDPRVLKAYW